MYLLPPLAFHLLEGKNSMKTQNFVQYEQQEFVSKRKYTPRLGSRLTQEREAALPYTV